MNWHDGMQRGGLGIYELLWGAWLDGSPGEELTYKHMIRLFDCQG